MALIPTLFRRKKTAYPEARYSALAPTQTAPVKSPIKTGAGANVQGLDVVLPKPGKAGAQTVLSVMTSAKPSPGSAFVVTDNQYASTDLLTLRSTSANTRALVSSLISASPEFGAAANAYARLGIPSGYKAVARNMDGTFNRDATTLVQAIITRFDVLGNQDSKSFDDSLSLRSVAEMMTRDILVYGACALELVLDKARLPYKLQPISFSQILVYPTADARGITPKQLVAGQYIDLDIATFFMVTLDQELLKAYAHSPLEPAIQGVMASFEFMNDLRRIIKNAIHPRMEIVIDQEKFQKTIPPDIQNDAEKTVKFMNDTIASLTSLVADLTPEEAIVHFDTMGFSVVDHGNTNLANEYTVISDIFNSKMTTGTKSLPSILGLGQSTANIASTETLMFMKSVEGMITFKLNEIMSCALTQAVRLMGQDVYVEFKWDRLELRPDTEQESFRALKQSRYLELLSLGMMTDDDVCLELTGKMTPTGYEPKAGTMFMLISPQIPADNGTNGTAAAGSGSNGGSAVNKSLNPQTPTGGARGSNKKSGTKAQ
jgi:hypothetical protein